MSGHDATDGTLAGHMLAHAMPGDHACQRVPVHCAQTFAKNDDLVCSGQSMPIALMNRSNANSAKTGTGTHTMMLLPMPALVPTSSIAQRGKRT